MLILRAGVFCAQSASKKREKRCLSNLFKPADSFLLMEENLLRLPGWNYTKVIASRDKINLNPPESILGIILALLGVGMFFFIYARKSQMDGISIPIVAFLGVVLMFLGLRNVYKKECLEFDRKSHEYKITRKILFSGQEVKRGSFSEIKNIELVFASFDSLRNINNFDIFNIYLVMKDGRNILLVSGHPILKNIYGEVSQAVLFLCEFFNVGFHMKVARMQKKRFFSELSSSKYNLDKGAD
jgi:hypothetical protein